MTSFTYGPVEFLLIAFNDDRPSPEVTGAITELIESETIRLLDLVVVSRSETGGDQCRRCRGRQRRVRVRNRRTRGEWAGVGQRHS
ncbi:DUF6325 family protein [Glaciihabitans sp. dw_435]|uniref:DUF6325 family protein n=1 Tax=Glaciihabitans sp. dw_435 TaxID=2720081 RepID=UPI0035ABE32C